jgi:hypothetical protein
VLALAVLVVLLLWFCTPRDGRLFRRWHPGAGQHYWRQAGGWELLGLGVLVALFVASCG